MKSLKYLGLAALTALTINSAEADETQNNNATQDNLENVVVEETHGMKPEYFRYAKRQFTPEFIEKYAHELNLIGDADDSFGLWFTYKYLPIELMDEHSDALVEIAQAAGSRTDMVYRNLPVELMDGCSDALVQIAQAAGSRTDMVYRNLPVELMDEHSDALVEIAQRYGETHAHEVFKAFGSKIIEQEPHFRQSLENFIEVTGHGGWAWKFGPRIIHDHGDALIQIAEAGHICNEDNGYIVNDFYSSIQINLLDDHSDALVQIAQATGFRSLWLYEYLPIELLEDHSDLLVKIAQVSGELTLEVYDDLPRELIKEHPEEISEIIDAYGDYTPFLLIRYQEDLLEIESRYGETILENGRLFGITNLWKFNLGSYTKGSFEDPGLSVLENNIRNLDHNYNADKPIALFILGRDSGRFFSEVFDSSQQGYKVFVYESDNEQDAFKAIRKIGNLNGSKFGKPNKPIDFLTFSGRGNSHGICLYDPTNDIFMDPETFVFDETLYLERTDRRQFLSLSKFIADDGIILQNGSETGEGGEEGYNFVNFLHSAIPHANIYGYKDTLILRDGIIEYNFDENGIVLDLDLYYQSIFLGPNKEKRFNSTYKVKAVVEGKTGVNGEE